MKTRAVRFPLLDSVRAMACIWVMVFHAAFVTGFVHVDSVVRPWVGQAGTAAMVFFLISGFLLYRPFALANLRSQRAPRATAFWWRRALRVIPAYWVALTLIALTVGTPPHTAGVFSSEGWAKYYGFAQIYFLGTSHGGIPQAWTLCVEMTFYAVLPLWALLMGAARRGGRAQMRLEIGSLLAVAAASVAFKVWLLRRYDPNSFSGAQHFFPLPNYLDAFAIGMALGVVSAWNQCSDAFARSIGFVRRHTLALWVGAAIALYAGGPLVGYGGDPTNLSRFAYFARWEMQVLAGVLLLLPACFADSRAGLPGRVLGWRVLMWIGVVSYGFYLYHYALIDYFHRTFAPAGRGAQFAAYAALALVVGLVLASLSYYGLERPVLALKRLVGRAPEPARGEAVADSPPSTPAGVSSPR